VPFYIPVAPKQLNHETFERNNALFQFPAVSASGSESSPAIVVNDPIFEEGKEEAVGKVLGYDSASRLGIAMMRLDSLFNPKPVSFNVKSSLTDSTSLPVRFRRPVWWPDIDPQTGKRVDSYETD
jgi:hypothetical protein